MKHEHFTNKVISAGLGLLSIVELHKLWLEYIALNINEGGRTSYLCYHPKEKRAAIFLNHFLGKAEEKGFFIVSRL